MPNVTRKMYWTYEDLNKLTGMSLNTIYQHVARGSFDPDSLLSICCWLAQFGTLEVRQQIMASAFKAPTTTPAKPRKARRKSSSGKVA